MCLRILLQSGFLRVCGRLRRQRPAPTTSSDSPSPQAASDPAQRRRTPCRRRVRSGLLPNAFLNAPYELGTCPSAIASDSSGSYLYVTDATVGKVHAYAIASGALTEAQRQPICGRERALRNCRRSQVSLCLRDQRAGLHGLGLFGMSNGVLTSLGTYATRHGAGGHWHRSVNQPFPFTANYLGNGVNGTVSGFELNPTAGTLVNSQNSPYTVNAYPTAVAAIPHGATTSSTQLARRIEIRPRPQTT
jgi:hypothetical protein